MGNIGIDMKTIRTRPHLILAKIEADFIFAHLNCYILSFAKVSFDVTRRFLFFLRARLFNQALFLHGFLDSRTLGYFIPIPYQDWPLGNIDIHILPPAQRNK